MPEKRKGCGRGGGEGGGSKEIKRYFEGKKKRQQGEKRNMCPFFPSTLRLHPCSWGERTSSFLTEMFFHLITSIFLTEWSLYFPKYTSRKMDLPYSAEHRGSLMWDLTERARSSPHPSKRKQSHSCGKLPNAGNSSWNIQSHTEMQTQAQTHFLRLQFMGRSLIPTHIQPSGDWRRPAASRVLQFV